MEPTKVELIYFDGCPHVAEARMRVAHALQMKGLAAVWDEWRTDDPRLPDHLRGYPSPTVLIDGLNITGEPPQPGGEACTRDGAPPVETIIAALQGDPDG